MVFCQPIKAGHLGINLTESLQRHPYKLFTPIAADYCFCNMPGSIYDIILYLKTPQYSNCEVFTMKLVRRE